MNKDLEALLNKIETLLALYLRKFITMRNLGYQKLEDDKGVTIIIFFNKKVNYGNTE